MSEKTIVILALHLGYGGVEKYISSLCKMLEDNYKINIIATYRLNDKPAFEFSDNVNITYLINDKPNRDEIKKMLNEKNIIKLTKELIKAFRLLFLKYYRNIKAIKNISSKYIITTRTFHNKLVSKYAKKDIIKIATEHNFHNNNNKYIKGLINSLNDYDYLVTVSNELYDYYKDKIGKTKCIYIPNVIDNLPNKFTNLNHNNLINIGRLEPEKGQLDLIDIIYDVKKKVKDVKLYIIGNGSMYLDLYNKIKELKLERNVILTGFLGKAEMEKYLLNSKLFVMTSYTESFGLVLIEAMSYKVPCIAFDSASGPNELLKKNIGILVKDRNKEIMVNEIIFLLENKKRLKELSNNGYNDCKHYLIENVRKEWLKLLDNN